MRARRSVLSLKKSSAVNWYEIAVLPAVLVLVGYLILRSLDGQWWGVLLWVIVSPVVYLVIDFLFFGRSRNVEGANAKRQRILVRPKPTPMSGPRQAATPSDWSSAQDVSTGSEILRRGRRYDKRRA